MKLDKYIVLLKLSTQHYILSQTLPSRRFVWMEWYWIYANIQSDTVCSIKNNFFEILPNLLRVKEDFTALDLRGMKGFVLFTRSVILSFQSMNCKGRHFCERGSFYTKMPRVIDSTIFGVNTLFMINIEIPKWRSLYSSTSKNRITSLLKTINTPHTHTHIKEIVYILFVFKENSNKLIWINIKRGLLIMSNWIYFLLFVQEMLYNRCWSSLHSHNINNLDHHQSGTFIPKKED